MSAVRAAAVLTAALAALALAGCSGDEDPETSGTDPQEVTVGESFTWNDYTVADGWSLEQAQMNRGEQEGTMPVVQGTVRNNADEARFTLFQLNFAQGDALLATVPCTSDKLEPGDRADLTCSGLSASYPEGYDTVTVSKIER